MNVVVPDGGDDRDMTKGLLHLLGDVAIRFVDFRESSRMLCVGVVVVSDLFVMSVWRMYVEEGVLTLSPVQTTKSSSCLNWARKSNVVSMRVNGESHLLRRTVSSVAMLAREEIPGADAKVAGSSIVLGR